MEYCVEASVEAYTQEKNRAEIIRGKADSLFKWITLFVSIFNIAVPLIVKNSQIDYKDKLFVALYVFLMVFCVMSMIFILSVQFPEKIKFPILGTVILKKAKEQPEKYVDEIKRTYQRIIFLDTMTKQMRTVNDSAIKKVKNACINALCAIICMTALFAYVTLGM